MYKAYITALTNVRKHPNADRLLLADVFGNTVCVSTDYIEGQVGIYFPTDGQLSVEFAEKNNLLRKKDDAGNNIGGYMDPNKRNVTAIRLRGEKSDGLFLPLSALNYCYAHGDASIELRVGDVIDGCVNGHDICTKYIPRRPDPSRAHGGNKTRKHKTPVAPLFKEHADTEQLAYNLSAFKPGDEIEITLKMHGTSQRTGYLPTLVGYQDSPLCELRNAWYKFWHELIPKWVDYEELHDGEPIYDWGYVSGTRRVVLENYEGGFYGDNIFREQHSKIFEGKLWKGETVYYEVVGFTTSGAPIMASANNKKLNDKAFIKQYGEETVFSYGCSPTGYTELPMANTGLPYGAVVTCPQSDIYVYRMTMTNEDGDVVEYTPDFMRYRCEQMGVKTVPVFAKVYAREDAVLIHEINGNCWGGGLPEDGCVGDGILHAAERYYDGPDPIGKTHVREGVVVRIINRPKFCAYKHKNFSFKVLEGIIKDTAAAPDMEEAQDVSENT